MISQEVKPKWKELGYELKFTAGDLKTIDDNGVQTEVERCALQMLQNWRSQAGAGADYNVLIKALEDSEQNAYAAQLKDG